MTDAQQIVLFLAAYYLAESLYWARAGSVAFVSQFGEPHRPRTPFQSAGVCNQHGGLVPGNFLPWGDSTLGQVWPFSVSPNGVAAVAPSAAPDGAPESTGLFRSFDEFGRLHVDQSTLLFDDVPFAWAASPNLAKAHAEFLQRLAKAPRDAREKLIDAALAAAFDARSAAERLITARRATRALRVCCTSLFLCLFVALPAVAFGFVTVPLFVVVVAYFAILFSTLLVFAFAHKTLFPEARAARWKQTLMAAVSPADACHTRNSLIRNSLETYQPLALSAALSSRSEFVAFAQSVWLDLEHPLVPPVPLTDPAALATAEWFRERYVSAVRDGLARQNLSTDQLTAPPVPDSPDSIGYCPRCHGQYLRSDGPCTLCDLPLRAFEETALRS